jgi:hypothetical protein
MRALNQAGFLSLIAGLFAVALQVHGTLPLAGGFEGLRVGLADLLLCCFPLPGFISAGAC